MKISTILSKLEAIAQRDERLSLHVDLRTDAWGKLAPWGCTFYFEKDTWVAGWSFPVWSVPDASWRSFISQLDAQVVEFLASHQ